MTKLLIPFLLFLQVFMLASCSSDEPTDNRFVVDGELAKLYTGSYIEAFPTSSLPGGEYHYTEAHTLLNEAVPFEYIAGKESTTVYDQVTKATLTFNLLFASKSAELEIDSIGERNIITIVSFTKTYQYTPGKYTIASRQHRGYAIEYNVSSDKIQVNYVDSQGNAYGTKEILYSLNNYKREDTEQISATSAQVPFKSKYKGKFKVTCDEIATMSNDDFSFEFNPINGKLKELKPELRDLLELEISDQWLVPSE